MKTKQDRDMSWPYFFLGLFILAVLLWITVAVFS